MTNVMTNIFMKNFGQSQKKVSNINLMEMSEKKIFDVILNFMLRPLCK